MYGNITTTSGEFSPPAKFVGIERKSTAEIYPR